MSTDITLNGVGYMVLPGSYRADCVSLSAMTPGSPGSGPELPPGQRRGRDVAADLGRRGAVDGGFGGLLPGVGPVWRMAYPVGAAGLGPPPLAEPRTGTIAAASGRVGIGTRDFGFLASGTTLYRWTPAAITSRRAGMGAAAVDMAARGDRDIFVAFGAALDVARWQDGPGTWTASALGAGEQASLIAMLADRPVTVKPDQPERVYVWHADLSGKASYPLNGEILRMVATARGVLIATNQSWYLVEEVDGAPFRAVPVAQPVANASEVQLLAHRGEVIAAVDGVLWRQNLLAGGWQHVPAPGAVGGLAGFGSWVLARLTNHYGASGIWAWDGGAWFFFNAMASQVVPGPLGLVGATVDGTTDFYAFDDRAPDNSARYAGSYRAATALIGGGIERDKQWTRIGAEFHRPDGVEVGAWTAQLQYSADAGRTWTNAGAPQTVGGEHQRISAALPGVTARALIARVNLTAVSGPAPALAALWADWRVTEADGGGEGSPGSGPTATRELRRRWRMTLLAQDGLIDREGAPLGLGAGTIRANLWALLDQTTSFTDLDGTAHPFVRLAALEEEWPMPADAAHHISTRLRLELVEE